VIIIPGFKFLDFWAFCLFLLKQKNCHVAKDISQRGMVLIITMHHSGGKRAVFFFYLTSPYCATQENSSCK